MKVMQAEFEPKQQWSGFNIPCSSLSLMNQVILLDVQVIINGKGFDPVSRGAFTHWSDVEEALETGDR